jgi:formylglycine-generating enzyme required for sulfatase activity/predicted Ser/Thr protein kinase
VSFSTSSSAEGRRAVIQRWLDEFETDWNADRLKRIAARLPPADDPLRLEILHELVKLDLPRQWRAGRRVVLESYLEAFPELGGVDDLPPELVLAEFSAREEFGEATSWSEMARRFPSQVEQLKPPSDLDPTVVRTEVGPPPTSEPTVANVGKQPVELSGKFGRYEILGRLGQGGMGSVWLAQDTQLRRRVALKVPHLSGAGSPRILARFQREAQAAAALVHPNICPVFDVGEIDGTPFLTMAYIEGRPLSALLVKGPLPERQAVEYAFQLAQALDEAHSRGVVHRDLKPSNVMINQRGEPVLMDFGLAQLQSEDQVRITQSGVPVGTPAYMAPEQAAGDADALGPACDIYSLGAILFEMLAGRVPFTGTVATIFARLLTEEAPSVAEFRRDVDPKIEAVCRKALARRPNDRYHGMRRMARDLGEYLDRQVGRTTRRSATPTTADLHLDDARAPVTVRVGDPSVTEEAHSPASRTDGEARRTTPRARRGRRRGPPAALVVGPVLAATAVAVVLLVMQPVSVVPPSLDQQSSLTDAPVLRPPADRPRERFGTIQLAIPDDVAVRVSVDGKQLSADAIAKPLELRAGFHDLQVAGQDIETFVRRVEVQPGVNPPLAVPLTYLGRLKLDFGDVADAGLRVEVDDAAIEVDALYKPIPLRVGEHRVRLSGRDVEPRSADIVIRRGEETLLDLRPVFLGSLRLEPAFDTETAVQVDGKPSPELADRRAVRLAVGKHDLLVEGKFVEKIEQRFEIHRGRTTVLTLQPRFLGELPVELSDPRALVELVVDGKPWGGRAPLRLPVGKHDIEVRGAAFETAKHTVDVQRGPNPPLHIDLVPRSVTEAPPKRWRNSLGMEFALIPAGRFALGSPASEPGRSDDETQHDVEITRPFYFARHETTIAAFRAFVEDAKYATEAEATGKGSLRFDRDRKKLIEDANLTWRTPGWKIADDQPVTCVSWNDARAFCAWLSKKENATYRLPTEAEWEYACRGGSRTAFASGERLAEGNFAKPNGQPVGVATGNENAFGLFHVHGNVWEWCADRYGKDYYAASPKKDPLGPEKGEHRVLRGGSWFDEAKLCRSAYRSGDVPASRSVFVGFRVVREIPASR